MNRRLQYENNFLKSKLNSIPSIKQIDYQKNLNVANKLYEEEIKIKREQK